jgi:ribosomal protein S18 acetylase RimI-like enzyme
MVLRDGRPSDIAALRRLIGQLSADPGEVEMAARIEAVSTAPGHRLIVVEQAGAVVGLLHVFERAALEKPREAVVQALVVDSACRSSGVGEALMREAEAWARQRGLEATALYTRVDRDRARAFYERLGFRLKGTSNLMGRTWN